MRRKNLSPAPFEKFFPHFIQNLEETCLVCSDSVLKVIGDGYWKHHDMNVQVGRCYIMILISGSAAVSDGVFLLQMVRK